jgi:hypothetical protein
MKSTTATKILIKDVIKMVKGTYAEGNPVSYSHWHIGITENDLIDPKGKIDLIVFDNEPHEAVLASFRHFIELGMTAVPYSGGTPNILYIYTPCSIIDYNDTIWD